MSKGSASLRQRTNGKVDIASNGTTVDKAPAKPAAVPIFARYTCVAILLAVFYAWWVFLVEPWFPSGKNPVLVMHSWKVPAIGSVAYLGGLLVLKELAKFIPYDPKPLLKETMVLYNASQVAINVWMVGTVIRALLNGSLPFIWDETSPAAAAMLWIHYTDKYLEYLDTVFMVLRGRFDQVSFLHVYHHLSIGWCWWAGLQLWWRGDAYFGALCNSAIHIAMYSHYTVALLGMSTPWKKLLTKSQLIQFASVNVYSAFLMIKWYSDFNKVLATVIQIFEMSSLLVLFSVFYKKTYKKSAQAEAGKEAKTQTFTREEVEARPDLMIVESVVYSAKEFMPHHPGGPLFVSVFGGRDVTMAFQSYHLKAFNHEMMAKYKVGDLKGEPVKVDKEHLELAHIVKNTLKEAGAHPLGSAPILQVAKCVLLLLLEFSVEVAFLVYPGMRSVASSLVLGVLMALIGLNIQHDANHGAMSGTVGKVWGYLFGLSQDWIGGSSVMWIHQHVVLHHIHCNDADKDPDMGGAPLFRTHKADGPARWYMRAQHVYMFLLESIYGLVPLFGTIPALKNWRHQNDEKWAISPLAKNPHQFRGLFMKAIFLARFLALPLFISPSLYTVACLMLTVMAGGFYLALFFFISHNFVGVAQFGSAQDDTCTIPEDSFFRRQVESSSNVGGAWLAQLNGGLNYQIEHHLFPRIAHTYYPLIAPVVRDYCEKKGVKYVHFGNVVGNLRSTVSQLYKFGHEESKAKAA